MDNIKKSFKEKDVNRLRNLITKKYGDSTQTMVGFSDSKTNHEEGDEWIENNKKWTIKNGLKQRVTKLDSLKKEVLYPLFCPKCSNPMNSIRDKEMFNSYGTCFNCVIELETKLRIEGKYDDYIKALKIKTLLVYEKEWKEFILEEINTSSEFFTEQGDKETWTNNLDKEKIMQNIDNYIQSIKESISKI
jgi:hypothetical protein